MKPGCARRKCTASEFMQEYRNDSLAANGEALRELCGRKEEGTNFLNRDLRSDLTRGFHLSASISSILGHNCVEAKGKIS